MKLFLTILILAAIIYGLQAAETRKKKKQGWKRVTQACTKHEECCFGKEGNRNIEGGCVDGKCLRAAEEDCTSDSQCISGKCESDRGIGLCTTHNKGQYCTAAFQCAGCNRQKMICE